MLFGVLNINKPQGCTSHDVIARLRRILGLKKIGHLGTLDPMASGVLPVCVGRATRLIEYFPDTKRYTATMTLGQASSTQDAEGLPTPPEPGLLTPADQITASHIQAVLPRFIGEIQQRVPLHSAVHVDGKKLYRHAHAYAKTGHALPASLLENLPVRTVTIQKLVLLSGPSASQSSLRHPDFLESPHPNQLQWRDIVLDVSCGSGTYIRSLVRDLGEALGCPAHLSGLVRTRHGNFTLEQAVGLEALETSASPHAFLQLPQLELTKLVLEDAQQALIFSQGMPLKLEEITGTLPRLKGNALVQVWHADALLAIGKNDEGRLRPEKVFLLE